MTWPWSKDRHGRKGDGKADRGADRNCAGRGRERHDARSNAHRPWRTSSSMSARPSGSRASNEEGPSETAPGRCRGTNHPVVMDNGTTENLGVHARRVLLDMADPFAARPATGCMNISAKISEPP